jgi:uncharacterized membrane protein AbrB (regulator of aidB expression)
MPNKEFLPHLLPNPLITITLSFLRANALYKADIPVGVLIGTIPVACRIKFSVSLSVCYLHRSREAS